MAGEKEKVCRGTPSRYYSRHVLHMGGVKGRLQDSEVAEIETEGERQLKELLKKQLDTSTDNIHRDLNKKKRQFLPATTYQPLSSEVEGLRSLSEYQSSEKAHLQVDQLRQKGLSENEIELALLGKGVASKRGKYSVEPEAHKGRMEAIHNKMEERQDLVAHDAVGLGVKQLSRHAMEVENSLFIGCEKVTLMHHLVALEQRKKNPASLYQDKTSHQECTAVTRDGGLGQPVLLHQEDCVSGGKPLSHHHHHEVVTEGQRGGEALAEQSSDGVGRTEPRAHAPGQDKGRSTHAAAAVKQEAGGGDQRPVEPLPVQVIERHRLSVEQLKALPRFKDYHPGEPSKVLYVKNIHCRTGEEDLQAVFGSSGALPKVNVLSGRMRGQAFVEFDSIESASRAMELVNGYILHDKPLVVSYGHRRTQTMELK